jgi:hypothetical protein
LERGKYRINRTLNLSFRNDFSFYGEGVYDSYIVWTGATNGMMIDARCSNYAKFSKFMLDGGFLAKTFLYQAGNGVNASGSKGNVTGNSYKEIYCWNQVGTVTGTAPDYPDQYDPLSAQFCFTSYEAAGWYNSMDDSVIEDCRFAPNSKNNNFGIALSSSAITIRDSCFFGSNGFLLSNGALPWIENCMFSLGAPAVMDATHHHAAIKFDTAISFINATLRDCYHESMDYYGNGYTSILMYAAAGASGAVDTLPRFQQILIEGGEYSCGKANVNYIDIGANNRVNLKLHNAGFQGAYKPYVSVPSGSIEIIQHSSASSTNANNTPVWQPVSYTNLRVEYATPEFRVCGQRAADVTVTVGATDDPARLKFLSLDEALPFVSSTKSQVTIYLEKNDTIAQPITLDSNILLAVQGYTLNVNAVVKNFGQLTVTNNFANSTRSGAVTGSARGLTNFGTLTVKNVAITNLLTIGGGQALCDNVDFQGSADAVALGDAGQIVINNNNCTYSATGFVVNRGSKFAGVTVKSSFGATPTTGKWMRGTCCEFTNPSAGFPNQYWATADGIGAAANWAKVGNLS